MIFALLGFPDTRSIGVLVDWHVCQEQVFEMRQ